MRAGPNGPGRLRDKLAVVEFCDVIGLIIVAKSNGHLCVNEPNRDRRWPILKEFLS